MQQHFCTFLLFCCRVVNFFMKTAGLKVSNVITVFVSYLYQSYSKRQKFSLLFLSEVLAFIVLFSELKRKRKLLMTDVGEYFLYSI